MPAAIEPEQLRDIALFEGLNPQDLRSLLSGFEELTLVAGQTVFQLGDVQPALYVLLEGQVEIVLDVPGGQEAAIATIQPKAVFGESSFFNPSPHNAAARCSADSRLLLLSRASYDRMLAQGTMPAFRIGTKAAQILAARLQATDRWISELLREEQQAVVASWRRFREGLGGSFEAPRGFMHPY